MTLIAELAGLVGQPNVITGADAESFLVDWRGRYSGQALAVVRPGSTAEVAAVMAWCSAHRVPVVPQGGNTGLCGGATPDASGQAIVLSLGRLNSIRSIDTDNDTMVVEAGCILQNIQQAAEGSCTIGGNLATNAGGTQVLRYGNARDLVLGLEVVLPDGQVMQGLRGLRKDNTGYDLRNLFIGSEGTLGVITAATLKLYPQPVAQCTALVGLADIQSAVALLSVARKGFGPALTGFELIAGDCLQAVTQCFPQQRMPFEGESAGLPWYALLELSDAESAEHARERFETIVGQTIEAGLVLDAVIAENIAQSKALWHLRESIPLAEKMLGKSIKHDVSVPVSHMAEFVETTNRAVQSRFPGVQHIIFGHLGDGNLHYNIARGARRSEEELLALQDQVYQVVHDNVFRFGGSISAEHGVGQLKRDVLSRYKDPVEMALMARIKVALDPLGIMNPGKVLTG